MIEKKVTQKVILVAMFALMLGLYGAITVFAAPPNPGGYAPAEILDPECMPGHSVVNGDPFDCFVTAAGGGSGWSLTGDAGTDGGVTNFIGTTDAQDFVIKVDSDEIARFGQVSNVALGFDTLASGDRSTAFGSETVASGFRATAFGSATVSSADVSTAWGSLTTASGNHSTSFGLSTTASGDQSTAFGSGTVSSGVQSTAMGTNTTASGEKSLTSGEDTNALGYASSSFGRRTNAYSFVESVFGTFNTPYTPLGAGGFDSADRLFVIGNGDPFMGDEHNAFTLWKDGSFAYNDDNFQNDDPGTEQNMFYFNFGNHDGEGNAQTKKAIRLGSIRNDEWDVNSANVGDRSIAIGFSGSTFQEGPIASGDNAVAIGTHNQAGLYSVAIGLNNTANGGLLGHQYAFGGTNQALTYQSTAFGLGNTASGEQATAFGKSSTASGDQAVAFGNVATASGNSSLALGLSIDAHSFGEVAIGRYNTTYIPADTSNFDLADRLFVIGGGSSAVSRSDAFTILKNGEVGIGWDNFQATTNGNMFQVGDGAGNMIGYVDDATGNWVAISDERQKDHIKNIGYGLDEINQLRPVSFDYKRNGEHTIGFIAQEAIDVIPEAVFGSEDKGYGMSYQTLTPVLVNAIQELDFKFSTIQAASGIDTESFFARITTLVKDTIADMTEIIVQLVKADRIETQELCVDGECFTGDDIRILRDIVNERIPDSGDNLEQEIETVITDETVEESIPEETSAASEEEVTEEAPVVEESIVEEISEESLVIEEVPVAEESSEILE